MLLKFRLTDDGFTFANPADLIAAASIDYIKCHFDITAKSWKSTDAVVAVFKSATYNKHAEVLLDSNNNCVIDSEIYKRGGRIQVKLIGDRYINESVIGSTNITSILEFDIKENIIVPIQTPSKYDVFVAELEKAERAVEDVITDLTTRAERGDFDGADGVGISTVVYNADDTVTITLADGTEFTSDHSLKGEKGDPGTPGDSIANIAYGQDGTVTITLTSGTTFTSEYSMKGEKGDKGDPGDIPDIRVNGSSVISDDIANIVNTDLGMGYGYCETASNTTTKVVTLDGFKLVDGAIVTVLFKYAAPRIWRLNINGTGAKNVTKNAMTASGSSGMAFPELADTNIDHPVATFMYSASKNSYAFLGAAYMTASASRDGLMSASDKTKLDETITNLMDGIATDSIRQAGTYPEDMGEYVLGDYASAFGTYSKASGNAAHAEGGFTVASGIASHSEGRNTVASGANAHAEGNSTIANHASQHVFGEFNVADPSDSGSTSRGNYVEIVGKGTNANNRSNARTLDWSGNEALAGGLTLGAGTNDEVTISAAQLRQLLALI